MTIKRAIEILQGAIKKPNTKDGYLGQAIDMAIKALETLEEFEKAQIITGGRLNGRTYAYKCGLEDGKRKALEQKPCEDAISRQAVLDATVKRNSIWNKITNSKGENLEEIISQLPPVTPQPKMEWIPVSERLPEEEVEVLIYTADKEINKAYRRIKSWTEDCMEWLVFETLGYSYTYNDNEVVAWMPLPEPYRKESEE